MKREFVVVRSHRWVGTHEDIIGRFASKAEAETVAKEASDADYECVIRWEQI